jgi:N-acetylmuramic acid 6-phosphate etherase
MTPCSGRWDSRASLSPPDSFRSTLWTRLAFHSPRGEPTCRYNRFVSVPSSKQLTTEKRNPRSRGLDKKSTLEILRILNREDAQVAAAVRRELPRVARATDAIVSALGRGGRLFYAGAGTSGRLAVLDAAECPPTFGTNPRLVQSLIAGGNKALRHSVENAEDSAARGARDLSKAGFSKRDVAVGIAASGTTPYVLGALALARRRGAVTIAITSNPGSPLGRRAHIVIAPRTGAEIVAGSTRLKAGTAQKMILNLLSTAAMVRMGRVYEGWMVHVALANSKLRNRGVQILEEAAGISARMAKRALKETDYDLAVALVALRSGATPGRARRALASADGNVREALELLRKPRRKP